MLSQLSLGDELAVPVLTCRCWSGGVPSGVIG
jgi:hypothetical protein